jgi:hypothetical protein
MNKISKAIYIALGILVLLAAIILYAQYDLERSWVKYRLTVTIQTPEGEVSGSTVRAVKYPSTGKRLFSLPDAPRKTHVKGEAVVIDLGDKGKAFAVIKDSSWMELVYGGGGELPLKFWPKIVWFEDINDPKSVKLVHTTKENPENNREWIHVDNAAELFGEGYAVKNMTVEITDEPVTWGVVEQLLPWIWEYRDKNLDGQRYWRADAKNNLANSLGLGSFIIKGMK